MPTYFVIMNYTDDGIKKIKEVGSITDSANKLITSLGGRVIGNYGTMGQYDRISILEMPDDDAMANLALRFGASGSVRTTTIKAWPM